jgi:aspartate/methionine/tyrosine aminotransferase
MTRASGRLNQISEYYFSTKLKEIRERISRGEDIINLGIGNPDMKPSAEVLEKATETLKKDYAHGYQPYNSIKDLRIAFSRWYKNIYDVDLDYNGEILPLMGSKEGIMHLSLAFLNSGDGVLIPDPGYPAYAAAAKICGARVSYYNLIESKGWMPDMDELKRMDLSGVKILWINYPHMPTGRIAPPEVLKSLIEFAKLNDILIVNDNPYSQILNPEPISLLSFDPLKKYSMELNSLSKTYNMAGWRVGMIAGSKENINNVLKIKSNIDSGMFLPVQMAAVEALKTGKEWIADLNATYKKRREIVYKILNILGSPYRDGQAGLFVWSALPDGYYSSYEYADYLLDNYKIFITPGSIFGTNGRKFIRTSLCLPEEELERSLMRIIKK